MTALALDRVAVRFGDHVALDDASVTVSRGEMIGLIGPNGAGKTTLLRVAAGLLRPAGGRVLLDGRPIGTGDRRSRARLLAYLPQGAPCHWPLEVRRLVTLGRLPHLLPWQAPTGTDAEAVTSALDLADVGHLVGRDVLTLSGGERARVLLARALAVEPALLLADEPVSGLDPAHQLRVMTVLRARADAGTGVVVTLHDLGLAARFCRRLVVVDGGRVVADGTPADVLTPETLANVFRIRARVGTWQGSRYVVPWAVTDEGEGADSDQPVLHPAAAGRLR
ncbi:MAG: ABC transporter ATP-binding protein [Rhodospirillales bacterium]|nr:MAG: ABC transporter ATP-binding protein [Rhodospirillales bacterium]TVR99039.1 MAG: ABC transporter ATP-binding protein [Rhodospirillales bacterium]